MDINQVDIIKQEAEDCKIIQNLSIKTETIEPKLEMLAEQPENQEVNQIRPQKRKYKKSILDQLHEDDQPAVKIIKITDISALFNKPKKSKVKEKAQKVKDGSLKIKNVGSLHSSKDSINELMFGESSKKSNKKCEPKPKVREMEKVKTKRGKTKNTDEHHFSSIKNSHQIEEHFTIKTEDSEQIDEIIHIKPVNYDNFDKNVHIKTEDDLEIHDFCHQQASLGFQNFPTDPQSFPSTSRKISTNLPKLSMNNQNFTIMDQNFASDHQYMKYSSSKCEYFSPDPQIHHHGPQDIDKIATCSTNSLFNPEDFNSNHLTPQNLQNFPSSSQIYDNSTFSNEEHRTTNLKEEEYTSNDDDINRNDPSYLNPQIDSDENDSDTSNNSNSNYKFKDGKFICTQCNMQYKLLKNFERHDCLICKICKKVFTSRRAVNRHIENIHTKTDEIFECKDCNKVFKAREYLDNHIRSHEKIHECENCGKKFGSISRLNEHRMKYRNPEKLICKICDRKFASRSSLKFHMRTHDVDRQKHLKCEECSFTTDDNRTLVKHRMSHEKNKEKFKMSTEWLKCEKCGARLKNKQSLNNHMYYVHSEVSFQCNLCGIVVKTERNLKRHWKNIHENEKK